MYISDLNIYGFKSFAKKDHLKFGEGITAIVGPNGCGKTNIVDAIRWVLGEQKYSILRSNKMEDVIFSGTDNYKPLGVCEVSLTVHNNKGKLPLEYNDVEIGRRVFRNGDSEYFINRTPCRLKDIQDLFIDTGMGADAYSVIELKMIEQILSETTEDRKLMFEEAAGINKYKQQRRSALRKFEAVRTDLERVNDIIVEVEAKVKALALQLKRFERHEKLSEELRQREIALAFIKIKEYEEAATPLRKKIQDFQHLRESTATEASIHEQELDQLKTVYQQQQAELNGIRSEISLAEKNRDGFQRQVLVATEQRRSAESAAERLEQEKANNENRVSQLQQHIADYEMEAKELIPKIDHELEIYKNEKTAFEQIDGEYKKTQEMVDKLQDQRWDEQRKLADQESLARRTADMLDEKRRQRAVLEETQNNLKNELSTDTHNIELKKKELITFQKELDNTREKLEKSASLVETLQLEKHEIERKKHASEIRIEGLENQIQFYENLLESKDGFPGGVKHVLENIEKFPGIHGVLAELMIVDKKYKTLVEGVLGSTAGCLVAKDKKIALQMLQSLRDDKLGTVSVLPLKEFSALKSPDKKIPAGNMVIAKVSDLVKLPKNMAILKDVLLGNVLLVSNLPQALEEPKLSGWNLVDLEGVYAGTNLIFKQSRKGKGLVGRQEQLTILNEKLKDTEKKQIALEKELRTIIEKMEKEVNRNADLRSNIRVLADTTAAAENILLQRNIRCRQNKELLQNIFEQINGINAAILSLEESQKKLSPSSEKGEKILSKLAEDLTKANETLLDIRNRRDKFHQHVQDLRIAVLSLENKRENILFQKRTAEESETELNLRQKKIVGEIKNLIYKQNELSNNITTGEKDLQKSNAVIHKQRSVLGLKQESTTDTFNEIETVGKTIREEQHNREVLLEDLKSAELDVAEFNQRIKIIVERIQDRYNTMVPEQMHVTESPDVLEDRVERINRSIENIGPINMAVKDEHEVEKERLELLEEQKTDLVESEDNLRESIQKIDREARKLFTETFDQIKTNFEKLFTMFFEGGRGKLTLVGDPDPLEADIAIHAQPPGKKNSSLRMLSAGEKSLTAIALLFAIYQFKPSPYCILDEVDAPLDDVNIRKFTKVLEAFADETQFIVVTHNKLTMEAANYLYGVTMEQKGVSKLVSVTFDA